MIVPILLLAGCEDYLDISPDMGIEKEEVFGDYYSVRGYLDVCYRSLMDIHSYNNQRNYQPVQALADEAIFGYKQSAIRNKLNPGVWLNANTIAEVGWATDGVTTIQGLIVPNSFFCIRIANEVLDAVKDMKNLTETQRNELEGQAYFMRAWYYFNIIIRWGGMPILDRVYSPDEDLDFTRLTYHESSEWLISDLDKAIERLPDYWSPGDVGRATKVSAMALKSMAALYDASPTMCPELGYQYDKERCRKAAEYAHDVLEYIGAHPDLPYRLIDVDFTDNSDDAPDRYSAIFYTKTNMYSDEALWYRNNAGERNNNTSLKSLYMNAKMSNGSAFQAAMYLEPTQNMVDMYEVIRDGEAYDIKDPESGFDMNYSFKDAEGNDNRDPRLYLNVLYPGGKSYGKDKQGNPVYLEFWKANPGVIDVGRDYLDRTDAAAVKDSQPTGYVCIKFLWPEGLICQVNAAVNKYNLNTTYIRVAQIYLDYAEAMNEAYGPDSDPENYGMTAIEAVNAVRNRVGMLNVNEKYTQNADDFRERIRNERAVELMFENHRWWDLRRWHIAHEVLKEPIRGLEATVLSTNGEAGGDSRKYTFRYESVDLTTETRVFEQRHYWYPIPLEYEESFSNFKQNPGW